MCLKCQIHFFGGGSCWMTSQLPPFAILPILKRNSSSLHEVDMDNNQVGYVTAEVEVHNVLTMNNGNPVVSSPVPANRSQTNLSLDKTQQNNCVNNDLKISTQSHNSIHAQDISCSAETTIRELEANESSSISGVLRYCKQRILQPYLKLLGIIGLKPLCQDTADLCTCSIIFNRLYVVLITILLLSGYILQFLSCFRRDRGFAYKDQIIPNNTSPSSSSKSDSLLLLNDDSTTFGDSCKGNPIYVHLFPNILHFGSYLYVVYLYRCNHDEQLPNLLERVFIHAAQTHSIYFSQKRLIRTLQMLVFMSIAWIFLSLACQILYISFHKVHILYWKDISNTWKYILICSMAISNFWQDTIQVAVIASYSVHCFLLTTYLTLIESRTQHHSLSLSECIKEVGEIDKLLSYLNLHLGPALGPLILLNAIYSISSIAFILDKGANLPISDLITVAFNGSLWLVLLYFPLFKAAKLSTSCNKLRELGHFVRKRPFGYQTTLQTDLDSFLLYISTQRMNVHILRIPIKSSIISFCIGTICFGLLTWGLFFV